MHRRGDHSLEIDVGTARTPQELHDLLGEAFRFPDYYGRNWDAFDECIRDVEVPNVIQITGFQKLRLHLPEEAEFMSRCLDDFVQSHEPKITVRIS
jgi:ribonuclease inhibitor